MSGDEHPALSRLARALAPELATEVLEDCRRAAVASVRRQFTHALIREMRLALADLADDGAGRDDAGTTAHGAALRSTRKPEASAGDETNGWYVYGITARPTAEEVRGSRGVDGAPVDVVSAGGVAAVVSAVVADGRWGTDASGRIDLQALAPRASDHERILEEILEAGPVIPLRFGVLYPTLGDVEQYLATAGPELESELGRLSGLSEWGLTIRSEPPASILALPDTPQGGRSYLERRRSEQRSAEDQRQEAFRLRREIHRRMAAVSQAARGLPPAPADAACLLRGAYLVSDDARDLFQREAESALADAPAELGLTGELTGPWPAYHFTHLSIDHGMSA